MIVRVVLKNLCINFASMEVIRFQGNNFASWNHNANLLVHLSQSSRGNYWQHCRTGLVFPGIVMLWHERKLCRSKLAHGILWTQEWFSRMRAFKFKHRIYPSGLQMWPRKKIDVRLYFVFHLIWWFYETKHPFRRHDKNLIIKIKILKILKMIWEGSGEA